MSRAEAMGRAEGSSGDGWVAALPAGGAEPSLRLVHEWRLVELGEERAGRLETLAAEAVAPAARPDAAGLRVDLRGLLPVLDTVTLDVGREPEDLWLARGASEAILELWPLVEDLGWPGPEAPAGGLREALLRTLDAERAAALRAAAEAVDGSDAGVRAARGERSERWRLARAVGVDVVRAGAELMALGDLRGAVARQIGYGLLAHVALFEALRPRWAAIVAAREARWGRR